MESRWRLRERLVVRKYERNCYLLKVFCESFGRSESVTEADAGKKSEEKKEKKKIEEKEEGKRDGEEER